MWDQKFDQPDYVYGTEPSQFLRNRAEWLEPGMRALAIADGEGRNSVFLAEQGCDVTAMDSSAVGLAKARRLAAARDVSIAFQHADLRDWAWAPAQYDLVAAIFIQFADPVFRSEIFAGIRQTLRPGGLLLLHGYTPKQIAYGTGGPPLAELLYTREMLRTAFDGMELIDLVEYDADLDEGPGHSGRSALIDLVARRPA